MSRKTRKRAKRAATLTADGAEYTIVHRAGFVAATGAYVCTVRNDAGEDHLAVAATLRGPWRLKTAPEVGAHDEATSP